MPKPTAVVILAAGAGTRMKSKTPKVLHSMAGRTLLGHAIYAAHGLNPDHIVSVIGHQQDKVRQHLQALEKTLETSLPTAVQEHQNGTGHAVKVGTAALPSNFDGTIIVTYADVPLLDTASLQTLLDYHNESPASATVLTAHLPDATGYGRIVRGADGQVAKIVEHKDATDQEREITEINSGIYAFDSAFLYGALTQLTTDNVQGEMYLTDVVEIAKNQGDHVSAYPIADDFLVAGCNDRIQLAALAREMNRRIVERHMKAGVGVVDPATTWIDCDVTIGQDAVIYPNTQLNGSTAIGEDAHIGPDTTLLDVVVGSQARISRTQAAGSLIGACAVVGPFAYLRPGTQLGAHGKIGTYVETKNSSIGAGSKVPHLSYVGDAEIGVDSNIGASSVFVNYDGVDKNKSVIGNNVRIGSDNMIIAPVHVADGAYTGAGTVIKENVPAGALAVSGGKQRNIEGWVARKRAGTPADQAAQASNDRSK